MTTSQYFRMNSPTCIHETIGDEVIVANLDVGFYYSIDDKLGMAIWNAMEGGTAIAQIVDRLSEHFGLHPSAVEPSITAFLTELEQEGLIMPDTSRQEEDRAPASLRPENLPSSFAKPTFEKYTDMQLLLLLDPIHEVDETGWPNAVPEKLQDQ